MPKQNENEKLMDYNIPIEVVIAQTQRARKELADTASQFVNVLNMFEACANNVRNCSLRSDRLVFQPFFNAMFKGIFIKIIGAKNENQIYELTGIDGDGLWFKPYGAAQGKEFRLSLSERHDMAARIRKVNPPEENR